jgi:hypothetical protein
VLLTITATRLHTIELDVAIVLLKIVELSRQILDGKLPATRKNLLVIVVILDQSMLVNY